MIKKAVILLILTSSACSQSLPPSTFTVSLPNTKIGETEGRVNIEYHHPRCLIESKEVEVVTFEHYSTTLENHPSLFAKVVRGIFKFIADVFF